MPRPAPPDRRPARRAWLGVVAALCVMLLAFPAAGAAAAADDGPELVVSTTTLGPDGGTVTVTGSGFDPAGNLGTRPPFMGQPAGVYVVFGRFAETWRPSDGAPSSARDVIQQVWALPRAAHDVLDPTGENPEIVLMDADGSFTAEIEVRPRDGTGSYGIATYAGSGAINADEEVFVPIEFSDPATSTTTTTTTTVLPTTTTAPTTSAPTTTTTTVPGGSGTRSADGANGQRVTVTPANSLDPGGATVRVQGQGFAPSRGIYVGLCVDQGPGAAPSPCVGGVDMEGSGSSSAWISSNPPPYAVGMAQPFGPGGTFDVELTVRAADEFVDCFAEGTRCVIATRADHTNTADRSADVRVPVYFRGQTPPPKAPADPQPSVELSTTTVRAGEPLTVSGAGFTPGEQVQVWLHSDPIFVAIVVADARGTARHSFTLPADLPPGTHHVELRGLTSGVTVRSPAIEVLPAATRPAASAGAVSPSGAFNSGVNADGLAFTGSTAAPAAVGGALLLLAGAALLLLDRRRTNKGENG